MSKMPYQSVYPTLSTISSSGFSVVVWFARTACFWFKSVRLDVLRGFMNTLQTNPLQTTCEGQYRMRKYWKFCGHLWKSCVVTSRLISLFIVKPEVALIGFEQVRKSTTSTADISLIRPRMEILFFTLGFIKTSAYFKLKLYFDFQDTLTINFCKKKRK